MSRKGRNPDPQNRTRASAIVAGGRQIYWAAAPRRSECPNLEGAQLKDRTAFRFEPKTDRFLPTPHAASPWIAETCHGGATAALLAHIAETLPSLVPMDVARLTIDLLRPVPRNSPLSIRRQILRDGKRMQLVEITVFDDEVRVAQASVLRVEQGRQNSQIGKETALDTAVPDDSAAAYTMPAGFADLFTIVLVDGGFGQGGRGRVWFRFDQALVDNMPATPLQRAVAAADFGGGMSFPLDFSSWSFPSVDLTVSLHRQPTGPWTLVDARSRMSHDRIAICHASLYDETGLFGHSLQTVLVRPR